MIVKSDNDYNPSSDKCGDRSEIESDFDCRSVLMDLYSEHEQSSIIPRSDTVAALQFGPSSGGDNEIPFPDVYTALQPGPFSAGDNEIAFLKFLNGINTLQLGLSSGGDNEIPFPDVDTAIQLGPSLGGDNEIPFPNVDDIVANNETVGISRKLTRKRTRNPETTN